MSEQHEDQSSEAEDVTSKPHDEDVQESEEVTEESEAPAQESEGHADHDLFVSPDDEFADEVTPSEQGRDDGDLSQDDEPEEGATAIDSEPWKVRISELEEELATLTEHLSGAHKDRDDTKNRLLRTAADLDNMRKRRDREQEEQQRFGAKRLVLDLLPAVDNLNRALEHAVTSEGDGGILEGIQMVSRQIIGTLEKHGIRSFDSLGEQFDPQRHEAMQQVETPDHKTGEIINEFQKGYFIHDRLLRPAWVVVAKKVEPATAPDSDTSEEEDNTPGPDVIDIGPQGADGDLDTVVDESTAKDSEAEEA